MDKIHMDCGLICTQPRTNQLTQVFLSIKVYPPIIECQTGTDIFPAFPTRPAGNALWKSAAACVSAGHFTEPAFRGIPRPARRRLLRRAPVVMRMGFHYRLPARVTAGSVCPVSLYLRRCRRRRSTKTAVFVPPTWLYDRERRPTETPVLSFQKHVRAPDTL